MAEDSPKTISFDGQGLRLDTSADAEAICKELIDQDVEILILQGNTFGIEAAERVGLELAKQPKLREAHFKDLFTSRGREEVPVALSHLLRGIMDSGAQLTLLDLSDNAIGPIGAPSVIEFLESPSAETLEKLYFNNCGLGPEGSTSIFAHFPKLKKLRDLICGRNRLEDKGATNLSRALSELNTIEVLKIPQNGINVPGFTKIADALEANIETIRDIDFSDNTIKTEGSQVLAKVLLRARNLRQLRLDDVLLGNDGFTILCEAISKSPAFLNQNLTEVTSEGNELHGQKIVDLIASTFVNVKREFTLDLLENNFSLSELSRMEAMTEQFNILVDEIDFEDNEDSDEHRDDCEEGEIVYNSDSGAGDDSDGFNGYVDLTNAISDSREVYQDFVKSISKKPYDPEQVNSAFNQLISTGNSNLGDTRYECAQLLGEELGLIKMEETRKKKPLAKDAVIYIGKRINELPPIIRDFFQVVVKNNNEMECGKILFEKLEI